MKSELNKDLDSSDHLPPCPPYPILPMDPARQFKMRIHIHTQN